MFPFRDPNTVEGQTLLGTNDANGLPVRHYRFQISYDGTDFAGWQVQPRLRTVQGVVEEALAGLLGLKVRLHGSGRTDAGVHALGQVAHFCCAGRLDAPTIERALYGKLPRDVFVSEVREVSDRFDARRSAVARSYLYRIVRRRNPHLRRYAWEVRYSLDVERMVQATEFIAGTHDFTSFAASTRKGMENRIDITHARWSDTGDEIRFEVTGNRFIHRFVRNVVGTMVDVGRGGISPGDIPAMIEGRDRALAGPAAPAHGLYLVHVEYDSPDRQGPDRGEGDRHEVFSRHG